MALEVGHCRRHCSVSKKHGT